MKTERDPTTEIYEIAARRWAEIDNKKEEPPQHILRSALVGYGAYLFRTFYSSEARNYMRACGYVAFTVTTEVCEILARSLKPKRL